MSSSPRSTPMWRCEQNAKIMQPISSTCMRLHRAGEPLRAESRLVSAPTEHQVLLRVLACAVCRTDLHVVDGELPSVRLPVIPGHEIVGEVIERGTAVD